VAGEAHGAVLLLLLAGLAGAQLAKAPERLRGIVARARLVGASKAIGPAKPFGDDGGGKDRDGLGGCNTTLLPGEDTLGGAVVGGELDGAAGDLDRGALGGGADDELGAEDLEGASGEGEASVGGGGEVSDVGEEAAASEASGARLVVAEEELGVMVEDELGAVAHAELEATVATGAEEGARGELVADGEGSAAVAGGVAAEGGVGGVGGASEGGDLGGPGGASGEERRRGRRGRGELEEEGGAGGDGGDGGEEDGDARAEGADLPRGTRSGGGRGGRGLGGLGATLRRGLRDPGGLGVARGRGLRDGENGRGASVEGVEEAGFEIGGGLVVGAGPLEEREEGRGVVAEVAAGVALGDVVVEVGGGCAIDDAGQLVVDLVAGDGVGHGAAFLF
jgi:hypothetical protein